VRGSRLIGAAALVYVVGIAAARVVGFARESVIAYLFGASRATDAYLAATALPEFAAGILLSGVVGFMVIPAYARFRQEGRDDDARQLLTVAFSAVLAAGVFVAAVAALFAPSAMHVLAPGLEHGASADAARMLRISSPSITLFAIAGFAGAVLNTRKRFLAVPASLLVGNALAVILLVLLRGLGIQAAAIAYVGAAAATAAVQLAVLRYHGDALSMRWRRPNPAVSRALFGGTAAVVAVSTAYARPFIERGLASTLHTGDIAAVGFATKLLLLAGALVAVPIGTLSFPALADHAAAADTVLFSRTLRHAMGVVLAFAVPASVVLIVAARPIVDLAFAHGAFSDAGARVTAHVLAVYAVGLVPICAAEIVVRALLALGEQRAVLAIWSGSLVMTVLLDLGLVWRLGVSGLAFGGVVGLWANLLTMLWLLRAGASKR
jgi:putative peptidoglycan lipid II flippase